MGDLSLLGGHLHARSASMCLLGGANCGEPTPGVPRSVRTVTGRSSRPPSPHAVTFSRRSDRSGWVAGSPAGRAAAVETVGEGGQLGERHARPAAQLVQGLDGVAGPRSQLADGGRAEH